MTSEHDAPFDTAENDTLAPSPRRRRHTMTAVALVALLGAGTVACGGDDSANEAGDELAEQLAEAGAGVDDVEIDSESGEVDIETEDGSVSIGSDLPDDFPEDIPLPEDYELISSMGGSSDGEQGWTISGTLPDADEDTFDGLHRRRLRGHQRDDRRVQQRPELHRHPRRRHLERAAVGAGRRRRR